MTEQTPEVSEEKEVLTEGIDFMILTDDNYEEVAKFLGVRIERLRMGYYGFPRNGLSARTFPNDRLRLNEGEIEIWIPAHFKKTFEVKKNGN